MYLQVPVHKEGIAYVSYLQMKKRESINQEIHYRCQISIKNGLSSCRTVQQTPPQNARIPINKVIERTSPSPNPSNAPLSQSNRLISCSAHAMPFDPPWSRTQLFITVIITHNARGRSTERRTKTNRKCNEAPSFQPEWCYTYKIRCVHS